jgi:hypothetical protein
MMAAHDIAPPDTHATAAATAAAAGTDPTGAAGVLLLPAAAAAAATAAGLSATAKACFDACAIASACSRYRAIIGARLGNRIRAIANGAQEKGSASEKLASGPRSSAPQGRRRHRQGSTTPQPAIDGRLIWAQYGHCIFVAWPAFDTGTRKIHRSSGLCMIR